VQFTARKNALPFGTKCVKLCRIVANVSHTFAPIKQQSFYPWKKALVLYGISNAFMLFMAGSYFWDDWATYVDRSDSEISNILKIKGSAPWRAFLEVTVLQASPALFHLGTLVFFLFSSFFLYKILNVTPGVNSRAASAISLLFLLLPVNSARIAMIDFTYTTCYFFFFAAWYLLCVRKGSFAKFFALLLFFASFTALSPLVFVIIPIIHYAFLTYSSKNSFGLQSRLTIFLMLISPICYLICRAAFWPPNDHYNSYNTPQIQGTVRGSAILMLFAIPVFLNLIELRKRKSVSTSRLLIGVGLFATGVAAFPYQTGGFLGGISDWMINFVPNYSDWNSRHQLFLPLGLALITYGVLSRLTSYDSKDSLNVGLWVVVSVCVLLNITFSQEYFLDAKKQSSIISQIAMNKDLLKYRNIFVDDSAIRFNARGRSIRSYEWDGMFDKALGEQDWNIREIQYVECDDFQPELILRISSPDGRLKSTLLRNVVINIGLEKIHPCDSN
jgi:hypothetical protein